MDKLQKEIKFALPERLDSRTSIQKVEQSLHTCLRVLQDQQNDEKCLLLLQSGIMHLIKAMRLLALSMPIGQSNNILNFIQDALVAASEHGNKSNSYVVSFITSQCLDIILSDKFTFMSRIEFLNKLNLMFESADIAEKEKFLQSEDCNSKLKSLFQLVLDVGDYEFQVCILEFMFRLMPKKHRNHAKNFIQSPKMLDAFLAVKDSCFEVDCRRFLNEINGSQKETKRVHSFPCQKIVFGSDELQKPKDEGYNEFWVDFNVGSKRIIIFCENAQLSSQMSTNEDCWDTVSVWQDDVLKFDYWEDQDQSHVKIYIKTMAKCVPHHWDHNSHHILHIILSKEHNIYEAVLQILDQKKVSDVASPLLCFSDNLSQEHCFSRALDDKSNVESERKGSVSLKEAVWIQQTPGSVHSSHKSFKVSTPVSTITVESICTSIDSKGNTKRTHVKKTPRVRKANSKKKIKSPVVALDKSMTRTSTGRSTKAKSCPPLKMDISIGKKSLTIESMAKEEKTEDNSFSIVIPDSLPFSLTSDNRLQEADSKKIHAKVCDSEVSLNDKENVPQQLPVASQATGSSQAVRPRHSNPCKSNKVTVESQGITLRSSHKKRTISQSSSDAQQIVLSQGENEKQLSFCKTSKPSQSSLNQNISLNDKDGINIECKDLEVYPSSFEEFKAPKNMNSNKMTENSSGSSSRSNQTCSNRGKSVKRSSLKSEVSENSGISYGKTKEIGDSVLQDKTNTLNKYEGSNRNKAHCVGKHSYHTKNEKKKVEYSINHVGQNVADQRCSIDSASSLQRLPELESNKSSGNSSSSREINTSKSEKQFSTTVNTASKKGLLVDGTEQENVMKDQKRTMMGDYCGKDPNQDEPSSKCSKNKRKTFSINKFGKNETINGKNSKQADIVTRSESEDDNTDFRFQLETSRETLSKFPRDTPAEELVKQTKNFSNETLDICTKIALQQESRESQPFQSGIDQSLCLEKEQHSDSKKIKGTHKHSDENSKSRQKLHDNGYKSINVNILSAKINKKNNADDNSSPPARQLRKKQPKSYKESDESVEDCEVIVDPSISSHGRSVAQSLSDKKFLTKTKHKLTAHQENFVQKTFTLSISSTQKRMQTKNLKSDPYSFEEEFKTVSSYIGAPQSSNQAEVLSKRLSRISQQKSTESRRQESSVVLKNKSFSWDDGGNINDTDGAAKESQDSEQQKNAICYSSLSESSLPSMKFLTPDPTFRNSTDSQDQTSPHKLFYSQQKILKKDKTHNKPCGEHSASSARSQHKPRNKEQKRDKYAVSTDTVIGRNNSAPRTESSHCMTDTDKRSEISWIAKYKSQGRSKSSAKRTYKRKPVNIFSPESSPSQNLSLHRSVSSCSEADSLSATSPVLQDCITVTTRPYRKKIYSPLDIRIGLMPTNLSGAGDISDSSLRSSAMNKKMYAEPAFSSQESTPSEGHEKCLQERTKQTTEETSPSPSFSFLHTVSGNAAPAKRSNKANRACPQIHMEEEEEDPEELKLMKEMGLLSGPSTVVRPSKSALKKIYGDCTSGSEEELEEDGCRSAKRRCLEPKELFPFQSQNSTLKRKTEEMLSPDKLILKKTSLKGNNKTNQSNLLDVQLTNSNEGTQNMKASTSSISTDEMLSQPETEIDIDESIIGLSTLFKEFSFGMQKQIKDREQKIQQFTKSALQLSNKRINHLWTADRNKRTQLLNNFKDQIHSGLSALEADVVGLTDIEKITEATYLQQLKVLNSQREKLQKRVMSIEAYHKEFKDQTELIEGQNFETQKNTEQQMKKDMEQLRIKMLLDMQEQQLRRVKESLQKHFI